MAKKEKQKQDYSHLSLAEVIDKQIGHDASFLELDRDQQRRVLDFIKTHRIKIKVFGYKWYDILSNKFVAIEYLPNDELLSNFQNRREFDSFGDLFQYIGGDIYQNSCFYGYTFSEEEIRDFSIDVQSINFVSILNETIDACSYESIYDAKREEGKESLKKAKAIAKWFKKLGTITTYDELEAKYLEFTKKFVSFDAEHAFFSILLRKDKKSIKRALMKFVCTHDIYYGATFDSILLAYGRDAALHIIDHFKGGSSLMANKKRIKRFKDILAGYDSGTFVLRRVLGYRESLGLYYVEDRYSNDVNHSLASQEFFCDFDEFVSFVKGDLSDANLSEAPLSQEDIKKYKINENTKLPLPRNYANYRVKKWFDGEVFLVSQKWTDASDVIIVERKQSFIRFCDFVHFLKGDLSNTDLILCDGIENIGGLTGLKLDGIKTRSEAAEKLGLALKPIKKNRFTSKDFELTYKNEIETADNFLIERPEDEDYSGRVSYISDIHILHRLDAYKCKTPEDAAYVVRKIAKALCDQATSVNLIAGDTASGFNTFEFFVNNLAAYRTSGDFFFTLGNHELWGFSGENLVSVVDRYKSLLAEKGQGRMHLVQNNLFYSDSGLLKEINEEELSQIEPNELRARLRSAKIIIFGGMGFAGMNEVFNADAGIYLSALSREEEIVESAKFLALYEKVTTALKGKNLIVLTHMPMRDWGGADMHAKEGVVYVNGHSHRSFFYDDGKKRIYADNQIGYTGKNLSFKRISVDFDYDWFADYEDGIYEITKTDYEKFYRGIGEQLTFNREFAKLFMIKREETYMFFMQTQKGTLLILNGGSIRKAGKHSLEYFYENMVKYAMSVKMFLADYDEFQKQVSREVKRFGGDGKIHGSIVDIDFFDHLYLNPLDGTITPYFAYSMVEKYVYDNLPSLLKYECPKLFANYRKLIGKQDDEYGLVLYDENLPISRHKEYVASTEMYRISRILKGLQFTTKYNIVRLWNDAIAANASKENGKSIVLGIIDPTTIPQLDAKPDDQVVVDTNLSEAKPVLSKEKLGKIRDEKYKASIAQETNGRVVVEAYHGSAEKADYRCTVCGHTWSTRPDHFKSRQKYRCPKCKKGANE